MDAALIVAALALGVAGSPHCVAMCAAPCTAATGGGRAHEQAAFHLARIVGYALAGAGAAASVNTIGALSSFSPLFKPLWSLVHAAALALGIWLAVVGRQPAWFDRLGTRPVVAAPSGGGWQVVHGPGKAAAAGALWVAWPCGLLQSAVLTAALANNGWNGAAVMTAFAVASGLGLTAAPWIWRTLGKGVADTGPMRTAGIRLAGALLAGTSGWALTSGIWHQVAAYCGF